MIAILVSPTLTRLLVQRDDRPVPAPRRPRA